MEKNDHKFIAVLLRKFVYFFFILERWFYMMLILVGGPLHSFMFEPIRKIVSKRASSIDVSWIICSAYFHLSLTYQVSLFSRIP
ncbi:hypothetical protein CsSME_00015084 [Camellia sinensis var. sinensis]